MYLRRALLGSAGTGTDEYHCVRVRTHVSATITPPLKNHPYTGTLNLSLTLSPLATPLFSEPSIRQPLETHLTHALDIMLRRSSALDMESLCLISGQKCWAVRADMHVLSHDGNLLDAASIGVLAALLHYRREDTEVRGEEVVVFTRRERDGVPLSLLHWPLAVTFSFYTDAMRASKGQEEQGQEEEAITLVDSTLLEEQLRDSCMTVGMNKHGEVCHISKLGGVPIDAVTLLHCTNIAHVKVKEISKRIAKALEDDAKKRDRGGLMAELSAENAR